MSVQAVIEIEWCAHCGDHALAHWEDRDSEDDPWTEQRPGCPGWKHGYTTRSDRPGVKITPPWWQWCPHYGCCWEFPNPMRRELHLSGVHGAFVTDAGTVTDNGTCDNPECDGDTTDG